MGVRQETVEVRYCDFSHKDLTIHGEGEIESCVNCEKDVCRYHSCKWAEMMAYYSHRISVCDECALLDPLPPLMAYYKNVHDQGDVMHRCADDLSKERQKLLRDIDEMVRDAAALLKSGDVEILFDPPELSHCACCVFDQVGANTVPALIKGIQDGVF